MNKKTTYKLKLIPILIAFSIILIPSLCISKQEIDSLEQALEDAKYPENITIMNKLVSYYRDNAPQRAIEIAKQAVTILEPKPEEINKKLHFMNDIGWAYQNLGDYDTAERYINDVIETAQELDLTHNIAAAYNHLGTIYYKKTNYPKALEYYMRALEIFEEMEIDKELFNVYLNIGVIHYQTKDYSRALQYYNKALGIAEYLEDKSMEMMVLNNIAGIYNAREDYGTSINYLHQIVEIARAQENHYLEEVFLSNIGMMNIKLGNYSAAKEALTRALDLTKVSQNKTNKAEILINFGRLYQKENQFTTSLQYFSQAEELSQELNDYNLLGSIHLYISELYESVGKFDNALSHYKSHKNYSDSLFNDKNSAMINELQTKYETAEKEMKITQLKQEQEKRKFQIARSRHLRALLIIVTVSIVIILIILYIMYQFKLSANKKLEKLARFDYLTRVYNRRAIQESLAYHVNYFERSKTPFVVMILDVDNLKYINDYYGHSAGDYVLQKATITISNVIRKLDILGRWGGDEFLIILPFTKLDGAEVVGNKLREIISNENFIYNGKHINLTITVGIAEYHGQGTIQEIIDKADQALLRGKKNGKNQVVV